MMKEQNSELRTAWDFVENTGRSIFLTGKAGTGKTTFLKTVVERSRKRSVVVAPTGVAAINAGGVTIHSFFQLPFSPYVPGSHIKDKFDFSKQKRKIIASLDLLIIDEISMVRADLLDAIDAVLRRYRDHQQPFGGVQMLMIGDLAQLTPVVTPEDERLLKPYYDTPYFFGSRALSQTDYVTIQLTRVYRQQDDRFLNILNDIRTSHVTQADLDALNSRVQATPSPDAIRLTTHNQLANFYNESALQHLTGKPFWYKAEISGTFPEYNYPTSEMLILKVGAQVMFVKNDPTGKHRYYNGRIGHVTYADQQKVLVVCPGDEKPIEVEPLEWENTRYTLNPTTREIETDVQGTFRQLPLRLAWAITIHKSQGLTFDHAIIDANQSFAPGQVYVALSRCRSLEGLSLASPLDARAIITDQRVDNYIIHQETEAAKSIAQLPTLKQEYERQMLMQLFDLQPLLNAEEQMIRLFAEYFLRSHASLMQLHNQAYASLRQLAETAARWRQVINATPIENLRQTALLDRVKRSAAYFAEQLTAILLKPIQLSAEVKSNNKRATARLADLLPDLSQTYYARQLLFTKIAEQGFTIDTYLHEKQMAMLDAMDDGKLRRALRPKKEKTTEVTLRLVNQGLRPEQIAQQRSISISTVFSHLALLAQEGRIRGEALVSPEHLQAIHKVISIVGTANGINPIKALCPPDVSYGEIRLVLCSLPDSQGA